MIRDLRQGDGVALFNKKFAQQDLIRGINPGDGRRFEVFQGFDLGKIPGEGQKSTCGCPAKKTGQGDKPNQSFMMIPLHGFQIKYLGRSLEVDHYDLQQ